MGSRSMTNNENLEWRKQRIAALQAELWSIGAKLTGALNATIPDDFDDLVREAADDSEKLADRLREVWG
jgi:hypothetical protein